MPFQIVRNDITHMEVDAVVNAANSELQQGGGVCGAIFAAAGAKELQAACDALGRCETGEAVITDAFDLTARFIIHTVGPIWRGGGAGEESLLRSCYTRSLQLAAKHGCTSVAFPLISSGIYGYPKREAFAVAVSAITEFLDEHDDMTVSLVVFDAEASALGEAQHSAIEKYIDDHYVEEHIDKYRSLTNERRTEPDWEAHAMPKAFVQPSAAVPGVSRRRLEDVLRHTEETFTEMLLRLIDEKGMGDVETYKRANMDRKLFSKIRSNRNYSPGKPTVLALAVALRLTLDETLDLLGRAGYTLSHSSKADIIVEYFIREGNCDIHQINEALFAFEQPLL